MTFYRFYIVYSLRARCQKRSLLSEQCQCLVIRSFSLFLSIVSLTLARSFDIRSLGSLLLAFFPSRSLIPCVSVALCVCVHCILCRLGRVYIYSVYSSACLCVCGLNECACDCMFVCAIRHTRMSGFFFFFCGYCPFTSMRLSVVGIFAFCRNNSVRLNRKM